MGDAAVVPVGAPALMAVPGCDVVEVSRRWSGRPGVERFDLATFQLGFPVGFAVGALFCGALTVAATPLLRAPQLLFVVLAPAVLAGIMQMPGPDGIAVAEALRGELPGCASIIVTSHGRPGHLKRVLAAGVRGFLPKTVSAHVLADVVRAVHGGGRYVDPELAAEAISAGDSPLTPREADVLELAADGVRVEQIARRASLSPGTVRNYLSSAATKLGAANRHEAVQVARTHGWI